MLRIGQLSDVSQFGDDRFLHGAEANNGADHKVRLVFRHSVGRTASAWLSTRPARLVASSKLLWLDVQNGMPLAHVVL